MQTINERLAMLPDLLGYDSPAALAKAMGLDPNTMRKAMQGPSKPSFDTIEAITKKHPKLSPDWLLMGVGEPLRDGRALTPLPMQQADYTSGPATVNTVVETLLRERLADKDALIELLRAEVSELRGKSPGSSDAVGHLHTPAPAPLPTVGFRLSVQRRTNKPGMQQSR